ncbi:MAG TPA: glycosyltransferase family 4 protein [Bryobacteraceae bacterium]|nr:glycosyltransferase family 4 protein [Bryobacteraceae bacterium]
MRSIALLCNEYPPSSHGGIGTFTQVLGRALVRSGYRVRVAGSYPFKAQFPAFEDDQGVEVHRLREPEKDRGGVRARLQLYRLFAKWARKREIDLIEVPDPQGYAAFWPKLPVPVIARVHGSGSYFGRELDRPRTTASSLLYLLEKQSIRRADFWCSVSQYAAESTAELFGLGPAADISFVPVTVPDEIDFNRRDRGRVIFTGTLTFKKGIVSLMRAWPAVQSACPWAELHVYGKGDHAIQCMLARELDSNCKSSVRFHGHTSRPELYNQLQVARVAVFPSYAEAFAFAPLEAMATGCPTVYSTRTSGPEAMDHEVHGLLADPDRVPDLSRAIIRLLTDDDLARRLGHAGRQHVAENFSVEKVVAGIEYFYRSCLLRFHGTAAVRKAVA